MLNQEGWSLLFIIGFLLLGLGLGFLWMGREHSMTQQLRMGGSAADSAAGVVLRCMGPLALAVIPGVVYQNGLARAGIAVCAAAGVLVLATVLVPRLRWASAGALTVPEALTEQKGVRAVYAGLCCLQALLLAGEAISLTARILAGVFSLHYTIALAASAGVCLLLTALCGAQSRLRMDRAQCTLLVLALVGIPTTAVALFYDTKTVLASGLVLEQTGTELALGLLSDVLWGVGALGLMLPTQRLMGVEKEKDLCVGGAAGGCVTALLLLAAALSGLLGRSVDAGLAGQTAAETVLMQMAQSPKLAAPVSAAFVAALVTTLLLFAQDALHALGGWVSWDLVQNLTGQTCERPLLRIALAVSLAGGLIVFALGFNANVPLMFFALAACLVSAVLLPGLILRVCRRAVHPLGAYCGLGLGTLMAIVWMAVPALRQMGMLGAIPCAGLSALLQLFVREKTPKSA